MSAVQSLLAERRGFVIELARATDTLTKSVIKAQIAMLDVAITNATLPPLVGNCHECSRPVTAPASTSLDKIECGACGEYATKHCFACCNAMPLGQHDKLCDGCAETASKVSAREAAECGAEDHWDAMRDEGRA